MNPRRTTDKYTAVDPAQARAYRLAGDLGRIQVDTASADRVQRPLAWALDVRRSEGDLKALIVGGAKGCPTLFVLEVPVSSAALGLVMGKAVALAAMGRTLAPGDTLTPLPEHFGSALDPAQLPGVFRIVHAMEIDKSLKGPDLLGVVAGGSSAAVRGPLAKLEATLRRLQRLREAEAPVVMRDNEVRLIQTLLARLSAAGWDRVADPLPPDSGDARRRDRQGLSPAHRFHKAGPVIYSERVLSVPEAPMMTRVCFAMVAAVLLAVPSAARAADTKPPKIVHIPIGEAPSGKALPVNAAITDESDIFEPTLYYRAAGTKRFLSASMSKATGAIFTATIPDVAMTGVVEYFIEAYDANGNGPARFASDVKPQKIKTVKGAEPKVAEPTPPPPPPPAETKPAQETKVAEAPPAETKPAETKPAGDLKPSNQVARQADGGSGKALSVAGYSAIGVGVVGVGLGAFFGFQAKSQRDQAAADPAATSAKTKFDSAQSSATLANALYIAGGVVAAAGVVLAIIPVVTGSSSGSDSHVMVGPGSVSYTVTF
ncbi:MAG: hypothetical protein QM765_20540 [Myxococcales bacterium]